MKCSSCGVEVSKDFTFAIKKNQCPACGGVIMPAEQLASFHRLKDLLGEISGIDVDEVASLVVANFEIKQLFKTSPQKQPKSNDDAEGGVEVVEDEELTEEQLKQKHLSKKLAEAKKLKKMRKEAYEDALRKQYGMGEIEDVEYDEDAPTLFENDIDPVEEARMAKRYQSIESSKENMLSGSGTFTRSSPDEEY